ncbi:MAG TPA: DUF3570 domain-containing protein [Kofleriaceae bacterium]|nr:DUF3570 domain-containing protein [Kofleriaceae bacterium]
MQLNRALALAVLVLGAGARADDIVTSKVQVYVDNDHTTVVTPMVQASADVAAGTTITAGYLVDAVTSASIDTVTQASPTTIHDTRHQVTVGASQELDPITVRAGYVFSIENDYLSHTFSGGATKDLFDKNTTLALDLALSANTVGRAGDYNFERTLDVGTLSASWTQVIDERTIAQLAYELADASGYQASPYRFVPVRATLASAPELWVAETDPDTRWRHALVLSANRAVGDASAIQGDYRIYHDTWGITSSTIGARYLVRLSRALELRLRERFYTQNAASFYLDNYTTPQRYMTYDRELSPLWSETFGVKLDYLITPKLDIELKLDGFYYHYTDFPPLDWRIGCNVGTGVTLTY